MNLRKILLLAFCLLIPVLIYSAEEKIKTPESSRHFQKYIDAKSGVVSWFMKPNTVAMNQQTFYFTNPSMSKDGRYLWFYCMFSMKDSKSLAVLDFQTDEVHYYPETKGCSFSAMVDPDTGDVYWAHSQKGIFRRSPDPQKQTEKICGIPENFPKGEKIYQLVCHLSWNPDKTKFFLDSRVDNHFFCGTIDIKTGKYTKWFDMDFMHNHAQFNPVREEPVFLCKEFYYDHHKKVKEQISIPRGKDGIYERLWLVTQKEGFKRIDPYGGKKGFATHEWWSPGGKYLYYCGGINGGIRYDLDTGEQTVVLPQRPTHAHSSANDFYFAYDQSVGGWYRGCSWTVHFYNFVTKKDLAIVGQIPAYNTKEKESVLHPDPHPQFVASDRYIASTFNVDGKMTVLLTPVQPLIEKTSGDK